MTRALVDPSVVREAFDRSRAERWSLAFEPFADALEASVAHAFGDRPANADGVDRYVAALHVDDLALAVACAAGSETAWDWFVREYRPVLQRAAQAIDPSGGRELADSLYAELYGLEERRGVRRSLFRYFHGRSRLATWLRTVLAQRHVDRLRANRRLVPLPDDVNAVPSRADDAADPDRARFAAVMRAALAAAIASLVPRDRLRLRCYYVQNLTLADIGRLLSEHEATASRHLARTRGALRLAVESTLRRDHGFDERAVDEAFRSIADDPGALDLAALAGMAAAGKNDGPDRSE